MSKVFLFAKKDFLSMWGSFVWLMPVCLLLFLMMGGGGVVTSALSFLPAFWVYLGCYNLCIMEERYQINRQNFLLPAELSQVVAGRYLFTVGTGALMAGLGAIVNLVSSSISGHQSVALPFFLLATLSTALFAAGMLTPYYAVGAQRSRFVALILYALGFVAMPQMVRQFQGDFLMSTWTTIFPFWPVLAVAGTVLVTYLGYRLSAYFYATRRMIEGA